MKQVEFKEIKCPACGKTVISHAETDYLYGSPLRRCPGCGQEVLDPYMHEASVEGVRMDAKTVRKLVKDCIGCLALFVVLAILNLVAIVAETPSFIMIAIMFFALMLVFYKLTLFLISKKNLKKQYAKQIQESEARMQDPAYREQLKALGYEADRK